MPSKLRRALELHRHAVGAIVRSGYRAPWRGVVVEVLRRKGHGDLVTVLVTHDRRGKPMRKPMRKTLDELWLNPYPCVEQS